MLRGVDLLREIQLSELEPHQVQLAQEPVDSCSIGQWSLGRLEVMGVGCK